MQRVREIYAQTQSVFPSEQYLRGRTSNGSLETVLFESAQTSEKASLRPESCCESKALEEMIAVDVEGIHSKGNLDLKILQLSGRYIGLDIHRDQIYVTILSITENVAEQYEISTAEKEIRAFLDTLRPDDQVALEATRGAAYYVGILAPRVAKVSVANTTKLAVFAGKKAKNDRNDSFNLALLLAVGVLPTVWIPDAETQQDREVVRYRAVLVKEQTMHKNQVRALLAEHGMSWPGSDIQQAGVPRFLQCLRHRLPTVTWEVLTHHLEQLELLEARITRVEQTIEVRASRWVELPLLMSIRGVNVLTAFTILAVIGRIDRFPTADSLANYGGLVPSQYASAGKTRLGKITKSGSKALRWALTEAVQSLCAVDGPYRNLCKRLERKNKGKGKAATACARKLLKAIWCMLTRQETFRHAEPELMERKLKRQRQRLQAATPAVAERRRGQREIIFRQLALLQDLASKRTLLPLPRQLLSSFGRGASV